MPYACVYSITYGANLSATFVCLLIPFVIVMLQNFYQRIYVGDLCAHFSFYFICFEDSCQ